MENASKALLIAASVLIVILLIAMGMKIFNSTSGTADELEGTMQTTEMTMFNSKFTPYIGNNKTKAEAMSVINLVIANNSTNNKRKINVLGNIVSVPGVEPSGKPTTLAFYLDNANSSSDLNKILTAISNATKTSFNINIDGYTDGYISKIIIRDY